MKGRWCAGILLVLFILSAMWFVAINDDRCQRCTTAINKPDSLHR